MTRRQFRVLYREFLFRMVDLELLSASAQGDIGKLLGQFAALLLTVSTLFAMSLLGFGNGRMTPRALAIAGWGPEHVLIATTMLVVGVFAVLSWDSTFPDRRDVLVLSPLPVRARTLFLAKVAAAGSALGVTVAAINVCTGMLWPLATSTGSGGLLDMIFSLSFHRSFAAYWITMLSAGAFIFCSLLGVQGLAACLLPRRHFLRVSAFLQMAAFCLLLCVYFLQPRLTSPVALAAPENQAALTWLPSYWFLGLFQQINGSMEPAMAPLARRAWTGLAAAALATCSAFLLSYFRTLRKVVEEPDILPGPRPLRWLPQMRNSLDTAVLQFSIRTLARSRQHRVMLSFYFGIGFAIVILFMRTPRAHQELSSQVSGALLFSTIVMMCVSVTGTRIVFSMPLDLRANWIFRITETRGGRQYFAAGRRPLLVLGVAPVWIVSTVMLLCIWPWRAAAGHSVVLGLWGLLLAYLCLHAFRKIPFTCSYLPGKSQFHMAFLAGLGVLFVLLRGVAMEWRALQDPVSYARMAVLLGLAVMLARWRAVANSDAGEPIVQFEELQAPAILGLGLNRDGAVPIQT